MDLTVAICTYQRREPLRLALDSLAHCHPIAQPWEVLVVDNAGDKWVQDLVAEFHNSARLPIRYTHEPRVGNSPARNHAVAHAAAPVVVFADDDVTFDPAWLQSIARAVADHRDCAFWGGRVEPVWPANPFTPPPWFDAAACPMLGNMLVMYDAGKDPRYWNPQHDQAFYTANLALRVDAVNAAGGFDLGMGYVGEKRWGGEDSWMIRTLARRGLPGWYAADAVVHHPVAPQRLTRRYARGFAWRQGWMSTEFLRRESSPPGRLPRWYYRAAAEGLLAGLAAWLAGAVAFRPARAFAGQFMAIFNASRIWHALRNPATLHAKETP